MGLICLKFIFFDMGGNFMDRLLDFFGSMNNIRIFKLGSCIGELERRVF